MARCTKCNRDVGCGCNLSNGLCSNCISTVITEEISTLKKTVQRVKYPKPEAQPNTEFDEILNIQGLSKDEKLKRINDIITKAQQEYASQLQNTGS